MKTYPSTRRAATRLLSTGRASPSEVADIAGVTRQLVDYWMDSAEIDWRRARNAKLSKEWASLTR